MALLTLNGWEQERWDDRKTTIYIYLWLVKLNKLRKRVEKLAVHGLWGRVV